MKMDNDNWTVVDGVDVPINVLERTQGMSDASGKVFYAGFSRMRDDWIITNDREQVKIECNEGGFIGTAPMMPISIREVTSPVPSEEVTFIRVLEYKGTRAWVKRTLASSLVKRDEPYDAGRGTITQLLCDELKGEK